MANSIRTPRQGVTAGSRRIAKAVDNEEWQEFRLSLKGRSTEEKLDMLKDYWWFMHDTQVRGSWVSFSVHCDDDCDICIRVDNYIKALCRGGQLYAGETLLTLINLDWRPSIKK